MAAQNVEVLADLRRQMAAIEQRSAAGEEGACTDAERAFRKVERLACMREHASAALVARLVRDGFAEGAAHEAVERAVRCGLVDDLRFADVLVRSRRAQGRGMQGIAAELEGLGIVAAGVPAFAEAGEACEVDRALALLARKPPRSKNAREGAYRRLMQKGYGASVSATAARRWAEQQEDRA